jgi:hypothetical protein
LSVVPHRLPTCDSFRTTVRLALILMERAGITYKR